VEASPERPDAAPRVQPLLALPLLALLTGGCGSAGLLGDLVQRAPAATLLTVRNVH
jgi:hypothetical protein